MRLCLAFLFALLGFVSTTQAADPKVSDGLKPFVEKNQLAGAVVLVASPEKVLAVETIGFADREAKAEMKPDAIFWIASMSKPMTAAAFMMLVDDGKVSLDDPIEKYLPEFKNVWVIAEQDKDHILLKKPKRAPTVRDCLRHTSGMPFKSNIEDPTLDRFSLRDGIRSYAMTPLQYEPGTKHVYSNAGINTAGRIIEVVSGMSYEEFMSKRLFGPLGMADTVWRPNAEQLKRLAKSYRPTKDGSSLDATTVTQLTYPLSEPSRQPMPAGGLFSTAKDVAVFGQMILNDGKHNGKRILSVSAIREMTRTQTDDLINKGKGEGGYGLGLSTSRMAKPLNSGTSGEPQAIAGACGHGGAYATNLWINPEAKLVTVFMVQHAGFSDEGKKAKPAFEKAAVEMFGKK